MAQITDSKWMTSFFFEQDLRSFYMNGLLNAGFKPGIYNPNICLYTKGDSTGRSSDSGLNLFIKKGTTLIFSNNYERDDQGRLTRNLDNVGSYLIKCFAMEDMSITLIATGTENDISGTALAVLGAPDLDTQKRNAAEEYYIVATINYNPTESGQGKTIPTFQFVIPNPNYKIESSTGAYTTDSDAYNCKYIILGDSEETSGTKTSFEIPEGTKDTTGSRAYTSYLFLGIVKDLNSSVYYLNSNGSWRSASSGGNSGDVEWIQKHAFIGRGFPEYRQSLLANKSVRNPELLLKKDLNTLALDIPDTFMNDTLIDYPCDYQDVWKGSEEGTLKSSIYKSVLDSRTVFTASKNYLIWDFYFLTARNHFSELTTPDRYSISHELIHASFLQDVTDNNDIYNNLNPSYNVDSDAESVDADKLSYPLYNAEDNVLKGRRILPLDVNSVNRDRLLRYIRNKAILPQVINHLRKSNSLDVTTTTSLVPIAIAFRKANTNTEARPVMGDYVSRADSIFTNNPTGNEVNRIHPCNILSFLDLQYSTSRINTLDVISQDVYSVLPVQE